MGNELNKKIEFHLSFKRRIVRMDYSRIAENISTIEDYHNFISSSKHIMNYCSHLHQKMFYKLQNHLWLLIKLFPDKDWDWGAIGGNVNTTWDIIKENIDKPWNWTSIGLNPNITWDIVQTNQTFPTGSRKGEKIPWDNYYLLSNKNFTWEIISKHLPPKDFDEWNNLSYNKNITWKIVKENLDKPWFWGPLCLHIKVTMKEIRKNLRSDNPAPWDFYHLAMNPNISLEDIENTPKFLEYTRSLSSNKNITWEFIKKHLDKPWNWYVVSNNHNITWNMIKNIRIPVKDLCVEDHLDAPDENISPWYAAGVSYNPNITWEIIIANPEFPWDFDHFSCNPNFTWKIVRDNKPFLSRGDYRDYNCTSLYTRDLTWKDVIDNPDFPWYFSSLSANTFGK
jgi:hypothetical protein